MTEEHYQDGIKLPTDKDNKPWELVSNCGGNLYRMKIDGGYLYLKCSLNGYDNSMCFVPASTIEINYDFSQGYEQGKQDGWQEDSKSENQSILHMIGDLSFKFNKIQDSLREFEKDKVEPCFKKVDEVIDGMWNKIQKLEEKVNPLSDRLSDVEKLSRGEIFTRIKRLEERHTRQIDENRKQSVHIETLYNANDYRIDRHHEDIQDLFKRIEKLESALKPEIQQLFNCLACHQVKGIINTINAHPRDTLQLCKHGAPVKTCTACY